MRNIWPKTRLRVRLAVSLVLLVLMFAGLSSPGYTQDRTQDRTQDTVPAKTRTYPSSIRGYKIEQARVVVRNRGAGGKSGETEDDRGSDAIVQLGQPGLARITPLGITFDVPIVVFPVKQGGHVDFLSFEDVVVNGTQVTIDDYEHEFDLPTKQPLTLSSPIRVFISTPQAILGVLDEWSDSKSTWSVSARVYVFGHFKKFLFKLKRVVPVELTTEIENPLRESGTGLGAGALQYRER
jgi:hypothetical protein